MHTIYEIAYQQNDKNKWYKYWHRLGNLSFVAIEFNNFLIDKMTNNYKYDDKDTLNDISNNLTDLNNKAFNLLNTNKKIDFKKLHNECEDNVRITFTIINRLDSLIEKIQFDLFKRMYKD